MDTDDNHFLRAPMIQSCSRLLLISVSLVHFLLMHHVAALSETTNGCHCFRNRTFNPDNRYASDDYLLTTTFNSLLASEFDISKRQIIMMKMREGVANNDLITALYIAKISGADITQLIQSKNKKSWTEIIESLETSSPTQETNRQLDFITSGMSDEKVAQHIINLLIQNRFSPSSEVMNSLKAENLHHRNIVLALTLEDRTGVPAVAIADQHLNNGLSWSEIAYNFGLQPSDVGKFLESKVPVIKKNLQ